MKPVHLLIYLNGIILLLFSSMVFSLGMANIEVYSNLNQPFKARIQLLALGKIPLRDVRVRLASKKAFQRIGLHYADSLGLFQYEIVKSAQPFIQISSKENINDPYITFLLKLQWPNGAVYRAYSILLDPPDYQLSSIKATQSFHVAEDKDIRFKTENQSFKKAKPNFQQPVPVGQVKRMHTVQESDSLWHIARSLQASHDASVYQIMLALYRANPNSFIDNNMERLKDGQKLTIPAISEIKKVEASTARHMVNAYLLASQQGTVVNAMHPDPKPLDQSLSKELMENKKNDERQVKRSQSQLQSRSQHQILNQIDLSKKNHFKTVLPKKAQPSNQKNIENNTHRSTLPIKKEKKTIQKRSNIKAQTALSKKHLSTLQLKTIGSPHLNKRSTSQIKMKGLNSAVQKKSNIKGQTALSKENLSKTQLKTIRSPRFNKQSTPQIQMKALNNAVEDEYESNLWFLDTFDASEDLQIKEEKSHQEKQSKSIKSTSKDQPGSQAKKNSHISPELNKKDKKQPLQPTPSSGSDEDLYRMLMEQNKTLASQTELMHQIRSLVQKTHSDKKRYAQASSNVIHDDNFWSIFWFIMTLAAFSFSAYLGYHLHLMRQMNRVLAAKKDVDDYDLNQDAIARSKRKVTPLDQNDKHSVQMPTEKDNGSEITLEDNVEDLDNQAASSEIPDQNVVNESARSGESTEENQSAVEELMVEEIVLDDEPIATEDPVSALSIASSSEDQSRSIESENTLTLNINNLEEGLLNIEDPPSDQKSFEQDDDDFNVSFDSDNQKKYAVGRKGDRQSEDIVSDISLPISESKEETVDQSTKHLSIDSKFDLATAYITMGDEANARQILEEIIISAPAHQVEIAKKLLNELDQNE